MGLFSPPPVPTPPPPPPAANPPIYASGATMNAATRPQAKPMGGTDLTAGIDQVGAQKMATAAMALGGKA